MGKQIIRRCDVLDSLKVAQELKSDFREQGYKVEDCILAFFKIILDDGYVLVSFENGAFCTECFSN